MLPMDLILCKHLTNKDLIGTNTKFGLQLQENLQDIAMDRA